MTPAEAIRSATTVGAWLMNMSESIGAVAPNYYADIIAVQGDPLTDITAITRHVVWVMKSGKVVVDKR